MPKRRAVAGPGRMLGASLYASPAGNPVVAPPPAGAGAHPIAKPSVPRLTPLRMSVIGALLISVGPISTNLYTPAFTLLMQIFNTDEQAIRSTVTVYLFGFAAAQLVCGPLSDRFGRRPVVIGGLGLYVAGSMIAGLAGSVIVLTVGRLIQGFGACSGMALSRVMVVDVFSGA
ncbi:MAG: MFS transporter, partial [Alphaproteobacteria bacterium]|nr:MFS transporter [Alphaproteobacteria bacterium]